MWVQGLAAMETECPDGSLGVGCDPKEGTFPQCFNLRGNAGRNIMVGPGLANLDFSLFRNNFIRRISENFNAQFRVEVFNILNRPTLPRHRGLETNPLRTSSIRPVPPDAVAGLLTKTVTTSRQIQFALKFTW